MRYRCPACRRSTQVSPEQADFLVRCDHCKAHFIARTGQHPTPDWQNAGGEAAAAGGGPQLHLADLLARSAARRAAAVESPKVELLKAEEVSDRDDSVDAEVEEGALEELVRARLPASPRANQLRRFQLRWRQHALGVIGVCGLLLVVVLALCVILLKFRAFPRPANAENQSPTPQQAEVVAPAVVRQPSAKAPKDSDLPATGDSSGELFPDVPAQK